MMMIMIMIDGDEDEDNDKTDGDDETLQFGSVHLCFRVCEPQSSCCIPSVMFEVRYTGVDQAAGS